MFKLNNLGLVLNTKLKFYTSVAKRSKLKVRKFWELIPTFVQVTGKKIGREGGGGLFAPSPILNRVKGCLTQIVLGPFLNTLPLY